MGITKELDKEFLMHSYTIYTKELWSMLVINSFILKYISQIRHSLVVIPELSGVSEVQYKEIMIIDNEWYQQE